MTVEAKGSIPTLELESRFKTPVTRVIITQPVSLDQLRKDLNHLDHEISDLANVDLTRSCWTVKGPDAENPWEVMAVGGQISTKDKSLASSLLGSEVEPDETGLNLATLQVASCREIQDEVHLQGVNFRNVQVLHPSREYSFTHSKRGRVTNKETWTAVRAPYDFQAFVFHPSEDKIHDVVALRPAQAENMLTKGYLKTGDHQFPLAANLLDEEGRKRKGVECPQKEVEELKNRIADHLQAEEIAHKLMLAREMIYHSLYHPDFSLQDRAGRVRRLRTRTLNYLLSKANESPISFNRAFERFLSDFAKRLSGAKKGQKEELDLLKEEIYTAWHRVIYKTYIRDSGQIPIQGEALTAAWVPLEDIKPDEVEVLENEGVHYARKLSHFISNALNPDVSYDNCPNPVRMILDNKAHADNTLTIFQRYERLELFRRLKIHEADGSLDTEEKLLLKIWQEHMYKAWKNIFGMTRERFTRASSFYNFFFEDVQVYIAPQVAATTTAPALLARAQDSTVSQLEELLLMAHGYSQYREANRGEVITPQAIVDARMKLTLLPLIDRALQYYDSAIGRTTYFWRRIINQLSTASDEQYMICKLPGQKNVSILPTLEASTAGIPVIRRYTGLQHEDVDIFLLETTKDKRPESLIRKMLERGWEPEKILDVYRTSFIIDTESAESAQALESEYREYKTKCKTNRVKALKFKDWKKEWANKAICEVLLPAISGTADALHYSYKTSHYKQTLDTAEPTGGSAASVGGYFEAKFYAEIDLPPELKGLRPGERETIEVAVFPSPNDAYIKIMDDPNYAIRRWEMVTSGSGLRSLFNLLYPHTVYPAYADVAVRRRRIQELEERYSLQQRMQELLRMIYGRIHASII